MGNKIQKSRKLVCGLGNPGENFKMSRHNMGYLVIDRMIEKERIAVKPGKGEYLFGQLSSEEFTLILLKPLRFMNLSGIPVSDAKNFFGVDFENLLVVIDDINLPFGSLRLRRRGSDGGHKGLASIIYHLSTVEFPRLRIGIGEPDNDMPLSEYVLLNFFDEEKEKLSEVIDKAVKCINVWNDEGIEKAMLTTNSKVI